MNMSDSLPFLPQTESVDFYPYDAADFLLHKVDLEKVIDLGKSTHFGALEPPPPLFEPILKELLVSGFVVTMRFNHCIPLDSDIPEIVLNGRHAAWGVRDADALTLGFDMAARPDTTHRGLENVNPSEDMDTVWLSTLGFALSDGLMLCGPADPPADVVKDFQLGEDQLVVTELLVNVWEPGRSLAPWLQFTQQGSDAVLRVDERGRGDFSDALQMTLEDFYRHNPHITNLGADDLRQLGGFDL